MCHASSVDVLSNDCTFGVTCSRESKYGVGKINRGERPMIQKVSVTHSSTVCERTHDGTRRDHGDGKAADCAGRIETFKGAFRGLYKTVKRTYSARRYSAGES